MGELDKWNHVNKMLISAAVAAVTTATGAAVKVLPELMQKMPEDKPEILATLGDYIISKKKK